MKWCYTILSCFLMMSLASVQAGADTVYLKNGNVLEGEIVEENDNEITIKIYGGKLGLARDEIKSIEKTEMAHGEATEGGEEKEPELSVEKINSSYYSLIDEGVKKIKFKMNVSSARLLINELGREKTDEFSRKFNEMNFIVTYDLQAPSSEKAVDISISNKPSFDDNLLNSKTSELIDIGKGMAEWFLAVWLPYATKVIDEKRWKVESIKFENNDKEIKVKLSNEDKERTLAFDSTYRLKDWRSWDIMYEEEPRFDRYKSKYLIMAIYSSEFGRIDILYHTVEGIKVPKDVFFYMENITAPDGIMSFVTMEKQITPPQSL